MSDAIERRTASVVLVGDFNPAIFSPAWLAQTDLVSQEAANAAEVAVIHPEVAVFQVDGYSFDVRQNRFSVEVAADPLVRALDAALVIFDQLLPHTPMTEYGINYVEHFRLNSADQRVRLGRALAPLEPWGAWGEEIGELTGELTSGMIELSMLRAYDPPGSGERRVNVQPSRVVEPITMGVFIAVNDHRIFKQEKRRPGARSLMTSLRDSYDESLDIGREIASHLRTYALAL